MSIDFTPNGLLELRGFQATGVPNGIRGGIGANHRRLPSAKRGKTRACVATEPGEADGGRARMTVVGGQFGDSRCAGRCGEVLTETRKCLHFATCILSPISTAR